jgi:hypothetical protein
MVGFASFIGPSSLRHCSANALESRKDTAEESERWMKVMLPLPSVTPPLLAVSSALSHLVTCPDTSPHKAVRDRLRPLLPPDGVAPTMLIGAPLPSVPLMPIPMV